MVAIAVQIQDFLFKFTEQWIVLGVEQDASIYLQLVFFCNSDDLFEKQIDHFSTSLKILVQASIQLNKTKSSIFPNYLFQMINQVTFLKSSKLQ